jgi:transposase
LSFEEEIIALKNAISQKESLISEKERLLLEKDAQILEKDTLLSEQATLLSKQATAIEQREVVIESQDKVIQALTSMVNELKRKLFQPLRSEQFDASQAQAVLEQVPDEVRTYIEEKAAQAQAREKEKALAGENPPVHKSKHQGRRKLPTHLAVEEVVIEPEGDLSDFVCIGEEITEQLDYQPEKLILRKTIRKKYAPKSGEGSFQIATLPTGIIEKGLATHPLLSHIVVSKYIDHQPLYRIRQRFARLGMELCESTLNGWVRRVAEVLEILYNYHRQMVLAKGYLQVDETTLQVLDKNVKKASHLGYYWVYHCPVDSTMFFEYHPTREGKHPLNTLQDFKGYLQTDGYAAYEKIGKQEQVKPVACLAHIRRKFKEAESNDPARATTILVYIQMLYAVERRAREEELSPAERKALRLEQALPIFNKIGVWLSEEILNPEVLPKSAIGKAISYALSRWQTMAAYFEDGHLEIDNNLIENAIRGLALGRKNYLFAGSHEAAQRAAIFYTFLEMCKKHEVNPEKWLNYVLDHILDVSIQELDQLLPQNAPQFCKM